MKSSPFHIFSRLLTIGEHACKSRERHTLRTTRRRYTRRIAREYHTLGASSRAMKEAAEPESRDMWMHEKRRVNVLCYHYDMRWEFQFFDDKSLMVPRARPAAILHTDIGYMPPRDDIRFRGANTDKSIATITFRGSCSSQKWRYPSEDHIAISPHFGELASSHTFLAATSIIRPGDIFQPPLTLSISAKLPHYTLRPCILYYHRQIFSG